MTKTFPLFVIEDANTEVQIELAEKEKSLRKVNENIRFFERLRIFSNSLEVNKQLYSEKKKAEKLEAECEELRKKLI